MKKTIEIHNNFLPNQIENEIENLLLNQSIIRYQYQQNSAPNNINLYQPSFNYEFVSAKNSQILFEPYIFSLFNVLYSFCNYRSIYLTEIIQARSWLSVPSPNPLPEGIHVDLDFPHWVFLYYVNDSDGDTILFNSQEEEIQRITPEKGKALFFDGSIQHCGSQPSKNHRSIINFNFLGKFFGDKK